MDGIASIGIVAIGVLAAVQVYRWANERFSTDHAVMLAALILGWSAFAIATLNHADEDGTMWVTLTGISAIYGAGWYFSNKFGAKWGLTAAGVAFVGVLGFWVSTL